MAPTSGKEAGLKQIGQKVSCGMHEVVGKAGEFLYRSTTDRFDSPLSQMSSLHYTRCGGRLVRELEEESG